MVFLQILLLTNKLGIQWKILCQKIYSQVYSHEYTIKWRKQTLQTYIFMSLTFKAFHLLWTCSHNPWDPNKRRLRSET